MKNKNTDVKIDNKHQQINIDDLPKATSDDVADVFSKLEGTIFQFKSCLFKIENSNLGNKTFVAELLNGPVE
jgi:hypothetical protein